MTLIQVITILLVFTSALLYVNHRWVGLPAASGVMLLSSVFSLGWLLSHHLGFNTYAYAEEVLLQIDFNELLMEGVLSILLFAGAFHIDLSELSRSKWTVGSLATFGVLASTVLTGLALWLCLDLFGIELPLIFCFLFGALISPTDPISVLAIMRNVGAPKAIETQIASESLFNDGVGVVAFIFVSSLAFAQTDIGFASASLLLVREVVGGALLGLGMGYVGSRLLSDIDDYQLEILLALALVLGGYSLASALGASSPIAVVVAGLIVGHSGRPFAIRKPTRRRIGAFWALLDKSLNSVLFVLIGLEFLLIPFHAPAVLAGLCAIPLVLGVRCLSVSLPVWLLKPWRNFSPHTIKILTWGGLRGGISLALALSLPAGPERDLILTITYIVIMFSILVQGLTIGKVIARTKAA